MPIEYETTVEQDAIARKAAELMKPGRRLRPDGAMNEFMRSSRQQRAEKEEANIAAKVAKVAPPPEDADIAALRAQAKADREAAASARRRSESLRKLHG